MFILVINCHIFFILCRTVHADRQKEVMRENTRSVKMVIRLSYVHIHYMRTFYTYVCMVKSTYMYIVLKVLAIEFVVPGMRMVQYHSQAGAMIGGPPIT